MAGDEGPGETSSDDGRPLDLVADFPRVGAVHDLADHPIFEKVIMTRSRLIGIAFGSILSVGLGWGDLKLVEAAPDGATSDLLTLQSWPYQINGKEIPRQQSLLPYIPHLRSRKTPIAEVATLAVFCEVKSDQASLATLNFQERATRPLFGISPTNSAESQRLKARIETRQREFLDQLGEPMTTAVDRGLSDAFSKEDLLAGSGDAPEKGKMVGDIIAAQADQYKTQLAHRHMRSILFDRCEALARSDAGSISLVDKGASVAVEGRRKNSMLQYWMVLRNQTGRDLHHVTLSVFVPPPPPKKPDDPRLVKGLGGIVSAVGGEDGIGGVVANANQFAGSVRDYEKLGALPVRSFYHIPLIPAGQEVTARFFDNPFTATFSVWSDEGTSEHRNFSGIDQLRAQVDAMAREFKERREQQAAKSPIAASKPASRLGTQNTRTGAAPKAPKTEPAPTGVSPAKLDYYRELQGTWRVIEQIENGRDISAEIRRNRWTVTRKDNTFTVKVGAKVWSSGTWTVDDTKDPVELTMTIEKGPQPGHPRHMIVKLEDGVLHACVGDEIPKDFRSPRGQDLISTKAVRESSK